MKRSTLPFVDALLVGRLIAAWRARVACLGGCDFFKPCSNPLSSRRLSQQERAVAASASGMLAFSFLRFLLCKHALPTDTKSR